MFQWYRHNGLPTNLDIPLGRKRDVRALLLEHYQPLGDKIPFEAFVNRLGFWMATGSGKTLVIVKLIELLWRLARLEEIPAHDILVLTHRDDLLAQLRTHVDEFNAAHNDLYIRLRELRDYAEVKRSGASLFRHGEVTVFTYRSDNLSDVQKEKIVSYRNYDNDGRWFVLLDEAHKGDKEESKRQHIYSILARNGFLFNFSATFTDERDQVTTAYDFNLARFTQAGYGKHISILTQENRAFRPDEDYTDEEKQKVVLKALLLLTYAQRSYQRLPGGWYHRPLLLTLVNSVNVTDSDLKLFFRQLARIGKGQVSQDVWLQAKEELRLELASRPELLFERERFLLDEDLFQSLQHRRTCWPACSTWTAAQARPRRRRDRGAGASLQPAGDRAQPEGGRPALRPDQDRRHLRLAEGGVVRLHGGGGLGDDSFFQQLNADNSPINILLGSRSFYEGWDSNRPNVITFINIGVGMDARKFILQSVGRGVRVEPLPGKRRRFAGVGQRQPGQRGASRGRPRPGAAAGDRVHPGHQPPGAANGHGADGSGAGGKDAAETLALAVNEAAQGRTLLIPTYRYADHLLVEERSPRKFEIAADELDRLLRYAALSGRRSFAGDHLPSDAGRDATVATLPGGAGALFQHQQHPALRQHGRAAAPAVALFPHHPARGRGPQDAGGRDPPLPAHHRAAQAHGRGAAGRDRQRRALSPAPAAGAAAARAVRGPATQLRRPDGETAALNQIRASAPSTRWKCATWPTTTTCR